MNLNIQQLEKEVEAMTPEGRLEWAVLQDPGKVFLTSSFGTQSVVLLHMISQLSARIPVVLIDTGYLFTETYQYINQIQQMLKLEILRFQPLESPRDQEKKYGHLWEQGEAGVEKFNLINRIEPMERAILELSPKIWISGIRKVQSDFRSHLGVLAQHNDIIRLHPIYEWSHEQIHSYIQRHRLPCHPLLEKGYYSVGDWPTTIPAGQDTTSHHGRNLGFKRECGIHSKAKPFARDQVTQL